MLQHAQHSTVDGDEWPTWVERAERLAGRPFDWSDGVLVDRLYDQYMMGETPRMALVRLKILPMPANDVEPPVHDFMAAHFVASAVAIACFCALIILAIIGAR